MSNSRWYAFKCWIAATIAEWLPDSVKRFVLYELQGRVYLKLKDQQHSDEWAITFAQMYFELRDK